MKIVDQHLIEELRQKAGASERHRTNFNLHETLDDPVQRFLNVMEPDSYVQPHRHPDAERWELFVAVAGSALAFTFDDEGVITQRIKISASGPQYAIEIPSKTWHTIVALESGTVLFEFKQGPYTKVTDKDFASWAPKEGDEECQLFLQKLGNSEVKDSVK